jgi:Spy/CpxP family protein refolding chaperone
MVRRFLIGSFILVFLLISVGIAVGLERERRDAKFEERLELLTMWKMMEALNLDKATAEKIMEIRHKFVDQRKALQREIGDDFRTLRQLLRDTAGTTSDDELAKVLTRIRDKRLRIKGLFDEQYNEMSKVLTVRQRAELVVFLKDFHKEIRSILRPSGSPNMSQDKRIMPQRPPQGRKSSGDQDEEFGPSLDR